MVYFNCHVFVVSFSVEQSLLFLKKNCHLGEGGERGSCYWWWYFFCFIYIGIFEERRWVILYNVPQSGLVLTWFRLNILGQEYTAKVMLHVSCGMSSCWETRHVSLSISNEAKLDYLVKLCTVHFDTWFHWTRNCAALTEVKNQVFSFWK